MNITILDETIEVDDECRKIGGCFNAQETLDDIETTVYIKDFTKDFKDEVFLDVGANSGIMSLFAKGRVYAFEPTISTYKLLVKNINLNSSEVTPICKAVCDEEVNYHMIEYEQSGFNCIEEGGRRKTITLDKWAKENNVQNIKLIKIDTEGTDEKVVLGGIEIIKRDKPIIITELIDKKKMDELGYKVKGYVCINTIWEPK